MQTLSENIGELVERRAQEQPEQLAYVFLRDGEQISEQVSYSELRTRVGAVATWLEEHTSAGDRVFLLFPQSIEFLYAYWACMWTGRVAVPMPPLRVGQMAAALGRVEDVARNAGPTAALTTVKLKQRIDSRLGDFSCLVRLAWAPVEDLLVENHVEGGVPPLRELSKDTLAMLQYTSGSTSEPKGVMLSHGNLMENMRLFDLAALHDSDSRVLSWLPPFHDLGLIYGLLTPVYRGIPAYVLPAPVFAQRPSRWVEAISCFRISHSAGPDFSLQAVVNSVRDEGLAKLDLSCLRHVVVGGEPVRKETIVRFAERFSGAGFDARAICPAWGLAEATCVVTSAHEGVTGAEIAYRPEVRLVSVDADELGRGRVQTVPAGAARAVAMVSNGRPLGGTSLKIVDPDSHTVVPAGTVGEVWVAGRCVAAGYWGKPDATVESFGARLRGDSHAYLRTGDLGFQYEGDVFLAGRIKDVVIIRGQNHYPQDIERTVEGAHSRILPAGIAAFAVEQDGGERLVVVAEVHRHFRNEEAPDVLAGIREAVAGAHGIQPHSVQLIRTGTLSKTTSGKIQRSAVRARFLAGELEVKAGHGLEPGFAERGSVPAQVVSASSDQGQKSVNGSDFAGQARACAWITRWLAEALGIAEADIDPEQSFGRYGVDSLVAARLCDEAASRFGLVDLDETAAFEHPSPIQFARFIVAESHTASIPNLGAESSTLAPRVGIVGMAGRFPGASNIAELWQKLESGACTITAMPPSRRALLERLGVRAKDEPAGYIEDVDRFDAGFFQISPKECEQMDPQQRILLQVVWHALEDAGITFEELRGSRTGVFVGMSSTDYAALAWRPDIELDGNAGSGLSNSIAANRVSYFFDLRGPSMVVDTACSSSLVALHQAVRSLRSGECDTAIVASSNLLLNPSVTDSLRAGGMMSSTARCHSFDARADGYVRGEGVAAVVLRSLGQRACVPARVHAEIAGTAINQDGRTFGLTAPNGERQRAVLRAALEDGGLLPEQVGYVEAHGTGTPLGDPIEYAALSSVYGVDREIPCHVGTLKANCGHLEAAAGLAGLIKAVLCMKFGAVPPVCGLQSPNPKLALVPQVKLASGITEKVSLECVGVTSMGFGGTNAHVVLKRAPEPVAAPAVRPGAGPGSVALPLAASSPDALRELARQYIEVVERPGVDIRELASAAARYRSDFAYRWVGIADDRRELVRKLRSLVSGAATRAVRKVPLSVLCLPSLEGAGFARLTGLAVYDQTLAHILGRHREALREALGPAAVSELEATPRTQRALRIEGAVALNALFDWLQFRGVHPSLVLAGSAAQAWLLARSTDVDDQGRLLSLWNASDTETACAEADDTAGWAVAEVGQGGWKTLVEDESAAVCAGRIHEYGCEQLILVSADSGTLSLPEALSEALPGNLHVVPVALRNGPRATRALLEPLAELYQSGHPVALGYGSAAGELDLLPHYPFQTTSHWLQHAGTTEALPMNLTDAPRTAHQNPSADPTEVVVEGWAVRLKTLLGQLLDLDRDAIDGDMPLLELGADSLVLTDFAQKVEGLGGGKLRLEDLLDRLGTVDLIVEWLHEQGLRPTEASTQAKDEVPCVEIADGTSIDEAGQQAGRSEAGPPAILQRAMGGQPADVLALFSQQLAAYERIVAAQLGALDAQATGEVVAEVARNDSRPQSRESERPGLQAPSEPAGAKSSLSMEQARHINELARSYNSKTAGSKHYAAEYRGVFADYRNSLGFRLAAKELAYPLVVQSATGATVTCADGHSYVDLTMAFGSCILGHHPPVVMNALEGQLRRGIQIGPRSPLAGRAAALLSELTGMPRVAFANSGTEAVMTALRITRTVTGRDRFVRFSGSYHGHADPVLVRAGTGDEALPLASGVPKGTARDATVLEYGADAALESIDRLGPQLAAVLVEPVQSRRPGLQPKEFLRRLRVLADTHRFALVFDEIITGFRLAQGGAQEFFGVRADLATYGKVAGGGMPLGVIAGSTRFMDAIDGGNWRFGDDSVPEGPTTFFAGTFCGHPMTMAATIAVLGYLKSQGGRVQVRLNSRCSAMADRINRGFEDEGLPICAETAGSMFRFVFHNNFSVEFQPIEASLFFNHMTLRGVYIWEGHTCFLSEAHTDENMNRIVAVALESGRALRDGGFFRERDERLASARAPSVPVRRSDDVRVEAMNRVAECAFENVVRRRMSDGCDGDLGAIADICGVVPAYHRLWRRACQLLAQQGRAQADDNGFRWCAPVIPNSLNDALAACSAAGETPEVVSLLTHAAARLEDVLTGKRGGTETLFELGMGPLEEVYANAPGMPELHANLGERVRQAARRVQCLGRPMRVLEVGAGTGATTRHVLEGLAGVHAEYTFSDLSAAFLGRARRNVPVPDGIEMRFVLFDLETDRFDSEAEPQGYDLIVAANVVHALPSIAKAIDALHGRLAEDGELLVVECVRQQAWLDLLFGLTDGWWRYADEREHFSGPLLAEGAWQSLLVERGMGTPTVRVHADTVALIGGSRVESKSKHVPLSATQREMLVHCNMSKEAARAHHESALFEVAERIDLGRMGSAVERVVREHESLSLVMCDDGQFGVVLGDMKVPVQSLTLAQLRPDVAEKKAREWLAHAANQPFNLTQGPLLRCYVAQLSDDRAWVAYVAHHLVIDGISFAALANAVARAYYGTSASPARIVGIVEANQRQAVSDRADATFWKARLARLSEPLDLPIGGAYPALQSFAAGRCSLAASDALRDRLDAFCKQQRVTPAVVLLATWHLVLQKICAQRESVVGVPVSVHNVGLGEEYIGFGVNVLPIGCGATPDVSFRAWVQQVREEFLSCMRHRTYPFCEMVRHHVSHRDASRPPLVSVLFNYESLRGGDGDFAWSPIVPPVTHSKYELVLDVVAQTGELNLVLTYGSALFSEHSAELILRRFLHVLEGALGNSDRAIGMMDVLLEAESPEVLGPPQRPVALDDSLVARFAEHVRSGPERTALRCGQETLSYAELDAQANGLAKLLLEQGAGPNRPVMVCLPRTPLLVATLLAVLKTRAPYAPIDPSYPAVRKRALLEASRPSLLVTVAETAIPDVDVKQICLEPTAVPAAQALSELPRVVADDMAYLIFTSGTTGTPKAVAVTHRNALSLVDWALEQFSPESTAGVLAATSVCFDLSVFECFVPLCSGQKVVLVESALALMQGALLDDVTLINTVPSAMDALVRAGAVPETVKVVNLAGEALQASLVHRIHALRPDIEVYNLYGPSEDTTYSTFVKARRGDQRISIGRPTGGRTLYLLDEDGNPVPPGTKGEICVAGQGVSLGYLDRPGLTAVAFVPDPFAREAGRRVYRTGDFGRLRPDGEVSYLGRRDGQVKIRGHRIEMAEIDVVMARVTAANHAVTLVCRDTSGELSLVAAYVPAQSTEAAERALRAAIVEMLPTYMMPARFACVGEIPLSANGKTDRVKLLKLVAESSSDSRDVGRPPRTQNERLLAAMWCDLLGAAEVSATANFFELGGHSLLATRLVEKARTVFRGTLAVTDVLRRPTIEALALCWGADPVPRQQNGRATR